MFPFRNIMSHKNFVTVPDAALQRLKCVLCNDYLSHFPVYICKGIGTVCGRCPVLLDENPIHNEVYEIIAETLCFPCRYSSFGCVEMLTPNNIADHEDSCTFRQYFCPFMPSGCCPWQGPSSELLQHFEEKHSIFVLTDNMFEVDFTSKYSENYLLVRDEHLFVIHKKCDIHENLFWCAVSYVGSKQAAKVFNFQLEFSPKSNMNDVYTFPPEEVDCFLNPNIDKNKAVEVNSVSMNQELNNPSNIICNVIISEKSTTNKANGVSPNIKEKTLIATNSVEAEILSDLECPICLEYMVPPIFQCETGHSFCGTCKSQINECSFCKNPLKGIRNFHLEKITNRIKYHCKYREFDCDFICSSKDIKQHEAECKFGPYKCPFAEYNCCSWKGKLQHIMEHARFSHEDSILDLDTVNVPIDEMDLDTEEDCFILQAFGEVFKLVYMYKHEEEKFYWSLQLVGPAGDAKKYMFALDIIDNAGAGQRLYIKRQCSALTLNSESFSGDSSYIMLPMDLLTDMIDKDLTYRVRVVKA